MSRKLWLLVVVSLAAVIAAAILSRPRPEPTQAGRTFSEWAKDLNSPRAEVRAAAMDAIRAMGPDAVPLLTNALARRHALELHVFRGAPVPNKMKAWALEQREWDRPIMDSRAAAIALGGLGTNAQLAIAPLIAALGDISGLVAQSAAEALGDLGTNAVPALRARLTNSPASEKIWIVYALGRARTNAADAAPDLAALLGERELYADSAVVSLLQIGAPASLVVTNYLTSTNRLARERALSVLQNTPAGQPLAK